MVVVSACFLCSILFLFYNRNAIMKKGTYDGNITMVQLAYFCGADIDNRLYASICLPEEKYIEVSKFLLNKGANPNRKIKHGKTPFLKACTCNLEYVKLFLNYGGNIQDQNDFGDTALHNAAKATTPEIIVFLTEKGLNINAQNKIGNTPLIISAQYSRLDNIKFLVKNGADINITNNEGHTAFDYLMLNMKKFPANKRIVVACKGAIKLITKYGGVEGKPIKPLTEPVKEN